MDPFVQTQIQTMIEGTRLLDAYPALQSGLRAELMKTRESIETYATALGDDSDAIAKVQIASFHALTVIESVRAALDTLTTLQSTLDVPIGQPQMAVIRHTLEQAEEQVGSGARAEIAERLRGIYVIVDPEAVRGRPVTEVASQSLEGGARVVQLRDKLNDKGPMLEIARELKSICAEHDALFVMNDHADLARAANADVLHVGQTDLTVGDARRILDPRQLIGNSNGSMDEALRSQEESVDYIAVGAIYSTITMGKSGRSALGPEMVERVKMSVTQPIVAIGGINRSNIVDVVMAGADSVCVVSAVTFADDPKAATEELVDLYESAANGRDG